MLLLVLKSGRALVVQMACPCCFERSGREFRHQAALLHGQHESVVDERPHHHAWGWQMRLKIHLIIPTFSAGTGLWTERDQHRQRKNETAISHTPNIHLIPVMWVAGRAAVDLNAPRPGLNPSSIRVRVVNAIGMTSFLFDILC